MPIKSIEIICIPCKKCQGLENNIRNMIKSIESINRIKIIYDFKHTKDLKNITRYSLNPSQVPVIIINGQVEFAGRIDLINLRRKLDFIHRGGGY